MGKKWDADDIELDFLADDREGPLKIFLKPLKIIIADDDAEVHSVTKIMLKDFVFEGKSLVFIDTFSGAETEKALAENPDTAVLFLDVVMEENHSGLKVVEYLRKVLKNEITRIILRTGQPGEAPEGQVIRDYDINDYRLKTDMTLQRLNASLFTALRNYRDLTKIEKSRKGLEKIIKASGNLFTHTSIDEFFTSILNQLGSFYHEDAELIYIRDENVPAEGFVTLDSHNAPTIVAATDKYKDLIGKSLKEIDHLKEIYTWVKYHDDGRQEINHVNNGLIIKKSGRNSLNNYIFIEGNQNLYDIDLINLFMTNYSVALDNFILNSMISNTQKEIIMTFGKVIEKHFDDTDSHVRRISDMMYKFAILNNFSYTESEMLKIASTMHDIGKISIPDAILKKPAKLTPDEFEIIKTHALVGYQILCESNLDILKLAAEIALNHHEKWDGTGYPNGLRGRSIPLSARIMSIIDVFDAMTHKRCYKDPESITVVVAYLVQNKGKHFDPGLVDIFIRNLEEITAGDDLDMI